MTRGATHHPDECVPMIEHEDTCKRLRNLYDAAVAVRGHVEVAAEHYAALLLEPDEQDARAVLERMDAALADAQEVLT